jgi:hypothetical protein
MKILGVVLVAVGAWILFVSYRGRRNRGGRIIMGMNTSSEVMDSIRGMYGGREPGKGPMIIGIILILIGLGVIVLA